MQRWFRQIFGPSLASRVGTGLTLIGLGLVVYSGAAYFGLVPGGYTSVPAPLALSGGGRAVQLDPSAYPTVEVRPAPLESSSRATATPRPRSALPTLTRPFEPFAGPVPIARVTPTVVAEPYAAIKLEPADAEDRREAAHRARPGAPIRLRLPTINVDTEVKEGGIVKDRDGQYAWETLPFVATNYPFLGPVGLPGNPVISGHVVTLREGNVFRDLYRVELGQPIEVYTENSFFVYVIDEIKLVPPTAIEVVMPTQDARLTVITCGGQFDPRTRTFSDRLIVVGKLAAGERL